MIINEHLIESDERVNSQGEMVCREIVNPQRVLDEIRKQSLVCEATGILTRTASSYFVQKAGEGGIDRFMFGIMDRGRVLFTFEVNEKLVGFNSVNLLNDGVDFFRINNSTVLHLSSAHMVPEYQGSGCLIKSLLDYIKSLPLEICPRYIEGFTQSPRVLRLITGLTRGRIVPNAIYQDPELLAAQKLALRFVEGGDTKDGNTFVIRNKAEGHVYNEKLTSGDDLLDKCFYGSWGVNSSNGDLLHFFASLK